MRAVLDPNVLISALLSRGGAPALIVSRWLGGDFELIVSPLVLGELARALNYPKLKKLVPADEATAYVELLRERALMAADPEAPKLRSPDPGDDFLLSLAEAQRAMVVSGDGHLLGLADDVPVLSPRDFLQTLEAQR